VNSGGRYVEAELEGVSINGDIAPALVTRLGFGIPYLASAGVALLAVVADYRSGGGLPNFVERLNTLAWLWRRALNTDGGLVLADLRWPLSSVRRR
jgi:hypothetical protein